MGDVSPSVKRKSDDVLNLDLDESESPFEPVGVLGTEHEGEMLTVYTMSGGGTSLVLSVLEESFTHPVSVDESDLTRPLRTGLSYLYRDGIRTVRVRASPDSVSDALTTLDAASLYRYDELLFTAKIEN